MKQLIHRWAKSVMGFLFPYNPDIGFIVSPTLQLEKLRLGQVE